jgi:integrase
VIVRLERNGANYRFAWTISGKVHRCGAGVRGPLSPTEQRRLIAAKTAELALDPLAATSPGSMTIAQWRERFIAGYGAGEGGLAKIKSVFDRLEERFGPHAKLASITESDARDFAKALEGERTRGGKPLEITTMRGIVRNAKAIFAQAQREGRTTGVRTNPFQHERTAAPQLDKAWHHVGDDDMGRILEACPCDGWRAMFALCRWAGMRSNEARALQWADIHLHNPPDRLVVRLPDAPGGRGPVQTTKHRERSTPIQGRLGALLRLHFDRVDPGSVGPCDGLPLMADRLAKQAGEITRRAGVVYAKPLHTLRKNLASEWAQLYPLPTVAQWLGHSVNVAMKHYVRADLSAMELVTGPSTLVHNQETFRN